MISPFGHPILGGLLEDPEVAALWSVETQIAHYRAFEVAYSKGLGAVGIVEASVADAAANQLAVLPLPVEDLHAGTAADGLPIPALVRLLQTDPDGFAEAIHTGTTSQDVMDTALALTLQRLSDVLQRHLNAVLAALDTLDQRFGQNTMMGRTRMQAALRVDVHHRIAQWRAPLGAHSKRLSNLRPCVEVVQLAGPVGDDQTLKGKGTALRAYLAEALGLNVPTHVWHSDRSALADYASMLSLISGSLGKLGQDVCLMAQQGVDEIILQSGGHSSAMPHKSNPIAAEVLVTLAAFNTTQLSAMHHALVHEQERSGSAWMLEWMVLPQMAAATGCALLKARFLVEGITAMGTDVS